MNKVIKKNYIKILRIVLISTLTSIILSILLNISFKGKNFYFINSSTVCLINLNLSLIPDDKDFYNRDSLIREYVSIMKLKYQNGNLIFKNVKNKNECEKKKKIILLVYKDYLKKIINNINNVIEKYQMKFNENLMMKLYYDLENFDQLITNEVKFYNEKKYNLNIIVLFIFFSLIISGLLLLRKKN